MPLIAKTEKKIPGAIGIATGAEGVMFDSYHHIEPVLRLQV
jgi:hypothetical protein